MNNYFVIERNGEFFENILLTDSAGNTVFTETMSMSYKELVESDLGDFIPCVMEAADECFGSDGGQTVLTLIGEDDNFIWSVLMDVDAEDKDQIRYCFIDWNKDGKKYRYIN